MFQLHFYDFPQSEDKSTMADKKSVYLAGRQLYTLFF